MTGTLILSLFGSAIVQAVEPVPATAVTLPAQLYTPAEAVKALAQRTQFKIEWAVPPVGGAERLAFSNAPAWETIEAVAARWGSGIAVRDRGKTIVLQPGVATNASISGPFRVAVRDVTAKRDVGTGITTYDLALDVHWEPRFPVFRVSGTPVITTGSDDAGRKITGVPVSAFAPIAADNYRHSSTIRLNGLTRTSRSIAVLAGKFTVTASPRMLAFAWGDLNVPVPIAKEQSSVAVTLTQAKLNGTPYDVELLVKYTADHPHFESFESWTEWNRVALLEPNRVTRHEPDRSRVVSNGGKVNGDYRFFAKSAVPVLTDATGWTLICEVPAPLREYEIAFEFKNIPLP